MDDGEERGGSIGKTAHGGQQATRGGTDETPRVVRCVGWPDMGVQDVESFRAVEREMPGRGAGTETFLEREDGRLMVFRKRKKKKWEKKKRKNKMEKASQWL